MGQQEQYGQGQHRVELSEARRQRFSPGTPVSCPSSSVNSSANEI